MKNKFWMLPFFLGIGITAVLTTSIYNYQIAKKYDNLVENNNLDIQSEKNKQIISSIQKAFEYKIVSNENKIIINYLANLTDKSKEFIKNNEFYDLFYGLKLSEKNIEPILNVNNQMLDKDLDKKQTLEIPFNNKFKHVVLFNRNKMLYTKDKTKQNILGILLFEISS
ncbi:hypothetical protein [Mycoplasmopsis alligatoris]|uniref:Uncharacterized protein n=1 Tax=Mycoplasmopsis alligatoris A21JP2 TaxID=747682 RepID=D4XWQ4_9BACT|nr:hypothetical protein [Mycoplasmopsis alligatoris]EFF41246.1 conserved hypothetical protein [Mycoplasmopsis alligatoris A21JP2]